MKKELFVHSRKELERQFDSIVTLYSKKYIYIEPMFFEYANYHRNSSKPYLPI